MSHFALAVERTRYVRKIRERLTLKVYKQTQAIPSVGLSLDYLHYSNLRHHM
jgi:hypothetical protein